MNHCGRRKQKINPREKANIFSIALFWYTGSLFKKGYKHSLEEKDLYQVINYCESKRNGDKIEKLWNKEFNTESPSISKILFKRFGLKYLGLGSCHAVFKIARSIVEPYALSNLVGCFKNGITNENLSDVYYYAAVLIINNIIYTIYIHNFVLLIQELSIKMRASLSSLIYRKSLKLSPEALADISLGNIVTILTKDLQVFERGIWLINDMWIGTLQTCVICYQIYFKMGFTSFIGVGFLLSVIPLQCFLGKLISKNRLVIGQKTDDRIQITQEILSAIRIIKMYTWEKYFNNRINYFRQKEVNVLVKVFYLQISNLALGILCSKVGFYLLIMSYIWLGYTPTPELIFYVISLFKELRFTLGTLIPIGIGRAGEVHAACTRVKKVLQGKELGIKFSVSKNLTEPEIVMKEACVKLNTLLILHNISLNINSKGLVLITGEVGSGKSSLIKTILQEYPLITGELIVNGSISYASQEPWLFPSSIKQNITFGQKFDEVRYQEVIRVCALEYDLNLFDKKDETIVADKGNNLSKGQQARVNLARAIYRNSDIYLLDDSLTALDAHVQDFIFNECIKGFLKDKLTILVTQNKKHLKQGNVVVILKNGFIKSYGESDDKILEALPEIVDKEVQNGKIVNQLLETEQNKVKKNVYYEVNKTGSVNKTVYHKYLKLGGGTILLSAIFCVYVIAQVVESYSDKLIATWVDLQQKILTFNETVTDLEEYNDTLYQRSFTINFYSAMILSCTILNLFKSYILYDFCRRASINLHKIMSNTVINAVMSFFDFHFIGNILNRFSQDLSNIDERLPFVFTECFGVIFSITGTVIVITMIQWKFLISSAIFFIILATIRQIYIPTGRNLKRLEASTRSPLVGYINSTLEGISTIRAYKAEEILKEEFERHQDLYTSAHYMVTCSKRAFAFFMDAACAIFIVVVIVKFVYYAQDSTAGEVGLALTQIFVLANFIQWGMRQWADLESYMTSVERSLEYTEIEQENKTGKIIPNWPDKGKINYQNVSLSYNDTEQVLQNINISINPNEKLGIVGRTGAGKSSIIATLFRLYEIEGNILIDNLDIQTISLNFLRQNIAIIPQDPILFTGTIRTNIDPNNIYSDTDIWKVLEKVKFKNLIANLDVQINESGSNFSSGQKQLICLARAIIRKNKIVVLDEATANMDPETDALLHSVVEENFSSCTVLKIAHRLHTVLQCNRVIVLDRGRIIEFDAPCKLLENTNGMFYQMVQQSGLLPQ